MKHKSEPRIDELHVNRKIRRVLAFEIIFVVTLFIIVFAAGNIFLKQQNQANTRLQSRYKLIVAVQHIEQLILINLNLINSYRLLPAETTFTELVKNHTNFIEAINSTQKQLEQTSNYEASELAAEKKISEELTQQYLKLIDTSNSLLGKEVLSTITAYKINQRQASDQAKIITDRPTTELAKDLDSLSQQATASTNQWAKYAQTDIEKLQKNLKKSQLYYSLIVLIQAILVIGGLILLSYRYVLPEFEKILKQFILQNEKLIKADTMKTEFLSIASHQLRTPLSVIKWSLALLLKPKQGLNPNQQTMIGQAKTSAETVIKLVGNLLNLSRIEQGRLAYKPVVTNIVPIIKTIIDDVQLMAMAKNVRISTDIKESAINLMVDPLLFEELIQNLVDNAIAYNRQNGIVKVSAREKEHHWYIDVADTGIGIMPEDIKNLFTKFYRGLNARAVRPDGSGLGLYFINKIAEIHGAKIKVESEPNQGTVFTVVLPKKAPTQSDTKLETNLIPPPAPTVSTNVALNSEPPISQGNQAPTAPDGLLNSTHNKPDPNLLPAVNLNHKAG